MKIIIITWLIACLAKGIATGIRQSKPQIINLDEPQNDNSDAKSQLQEQISDYYLELDYLTRLSDLLPDDITEDSEKQIKQRLILQRQIRSVNHKITQLYTKLEKLE